MPQQTFVLGMNAGLYQGPAGSDDPATMSEVDNVRDVNLTLEAGEADVTTRGNSGWRATAPTLRECQVEFQMVWRPGDPVFEAVKTAFLTSSTVALAVLDQKRNVAGAQGPLGDFSILNFSRNEALEEAIVADVTAKLARFEEWHEIAVGAAEASFTFTLALANGAHNLDLTAIPYGIGTYNGTGKRISEITVKNNGANALTIAPHASNGYDIGTHINGAADTYSALLSSSDTIGATDKIIQLTGTGSQTSRWTLKLVGV